MGRLKHLSWERWGWIYNRGRLLERVRYVNLPCFSEALENLSKQPISVVLGDDSRIWVRKAGAVENAPHLLNLSLAQRFTLVSGATHFPARLLDVGKNRQERRSRRSKRRVHVFLDVIKLYLMCKFKKMLWKLDVYVLIIVAVTGP